MSTTDWQEQGTCRSLGEEYTNLFFDTYENEPDIRESVESICRSCIVNDICLEYGKETQSWGVWGGVWLERGNPKQL